MSLGHGASVVRNGLVFQYDMSNTAKSWKGKPTTNVIETDLTLYSKDNGCTVVATGEYYLGNPVYRVTFNYGTLPRIRTNFNYTAGQQFNGSIYYRVVTQGSDIPGFYFREAGFGTGYTSTSLNSTEWARANLNYTFSSSGTSMFLLYLSNSSSTSDTVIDFAMPQVELGTFPTPFVEGTRSNTEVLIDISSQNNTITASSLTYNSDGSFEFEGPGTNNFATITDPGYPTSWLDPFSFEAWHYIPSGADWQDTITFGANSGTCIIGRGGYAGSIGLARQDPNYLASIVRTDSQFSNPNFAASYDTWYHIVGTWDGSTNSLYINGELIANATVTVSGVPDQGGIRVGGNMAFGGNNGGYLQGKLPVFSMYNRALTAEEVKQNFEATRGRYGI